MITLYGVKGCGKCYYLKKKLEEKNIPFEYCEDIKVLKNLKIMSVLKMEIDGTIYDFDEAIEIIGGMN